MGVHGLWRLIEPSGKPVPLESLENKVLAVDISIWLHQAIKGFQDAKGASLPNAHLLGIYHRVCKLLYFRIKPVFVFDGGVPVLKKETIAKRNQSKHRNQSEADRLQKQLLSTLLKHSAINKVLSETTKATLASKISPTKAKPPNDDDDNLYKLPPSQMEIPSSESEDELFSSYSEEYSEESSQNENSPTKGWNLHTIDTNSVHFKSLPVDVRHEILSELKETRKQNSWGRIHEMPKQSGDFSSFQMDRLLRRQAVQNALEEAEKEMGGHSLSLAELESLLTDQGVIQERKDVGKRIASDENTRYLLIKDVRQAMDEAKVNLDKLKPVEEPKVESQPNKADLEYEKDLAAAIALSLQNEPSTSKGHSKTEDSFVEDVKNTLLDFEDSEISDDEEVASQPCKEQHHLLRSLKGYMMEYSGLTPHEINKFMNSNKTPKKLRKTNRHDVKSNSDGSDSKKSHLASEESNSKDLNADKSNFENSEFEKSNFDSLELKQSVFKITELNQSITSLPESSMNGKSEESIAVNLKSKEQTLENQKLSSFDSGCFSKATSEIINSTEDIEIMSSSNDESDDFEEVESNLASKSSKFDLQVDKKPLEIVINPNEKVQENDLFSDIFQESNNDLNISSEKSTEPIEIVTNPEESFKNDLVQENLVDSPKETSNNLDKPIEIVTNLEKSVNNDLVEEKSTANILESNLIKSVENSQENSEKLENQETTGNSKNIPKITVDEMKQIQQELTKESKEIALEKQTKERLAGNITDQMYQEAQELLQLFGMPYVIAPMEAEAQCAFLDEIELTDGTITDDSDIWLFGGRTVYKNFFNQNRHVLEFKSKDIEHHFNLTRQQMILLALLVGSDYTTGISGVGPVTALEILAAFPAHRSLKNLTEDLLDGLRKFRKWVDDGRLPGAGKTGLRNKLKNIVFPSESFPSCQVVQAYLDPKVETSKEGFTWGKPDVIKLIDFAREKFGWTRKKSEDILNPVLKRLEDNRIQKSIMDYFKTTYKVNSDELLQNKMSKRVKTAVKRIGGKFEPEETESEEPKVKVRKTRTKKDTKSTTKKEAKENPLEVIPEDLENDEEIKILKTTNKKSRQRVEEIKKELQNSLEESLDKPKKKVLTRNMHKKEVIPQKERDKADMLKNKLKAIEVFRKSKQGPGFVSKRTRSKQKLKEDAELSENSSADD